MKTILGFCLVSLAVLAQQVPVQIHMVTNPVPAGPVILNESTGERKQSWATQVWEVISIPRAQVVVDVTLPSAGVASTLAVAPPLLSVPQTQIVHRPKQSPVIVTNQASSAEQARQRREARFRELRAKTNAPAVNK